MRKRSRIHPALLFPALCLWGLALGCQSGNPRAALASAQTLVQRAEQGGASQFAPRPLREAKDKVDRAENEIEDRDYDDARRLAEQAQVDAMLASAEADRAKTQQSVTELSDTVQALENDLRLQQENDLIRTPPPEVP